MNHQTNMSHVHHGLPLGLAAGAGVLLLFGVSWWTTVIAMLLVACPAAIAIAMGVCFCKIPGLPEPRLDAEDITKQLRPAPVATQEARMPPYDLTGDDEAAKRGNFASMRFSVVLLGFFVIAGVLLFTEHRAHALGALFYVLPLICLFMHMFMHGGHGNHARHDPERIQHDR